MGSETKLGRYRKPEHVWLVVRPATTANRVKSFNIDMNDTIHT